MKTHGETVQHISLVNWEKTSSSVHKWGAAIVTGSTSAVKTHPGGVVGPGTQRVVSVGCKNINKYTS